MYSDDIVNVNQDTTFIIGADDSKLVYAAEDGEELVSKGNLLLDQILFWTNVNASKINTSQTKAIIS